jgi:small-conductance mechanosensitive channel
MSSFAQNPAWWFLALITGFALAMTWLLQRVGRARAFAGAHRWIPILHVVLWAVVFAVWLRRLVPDEGAHGIARGAALILLAIAALPWLRNLFHAVVFGFENRYRIGDDLRVGTVEGRLCAIGPGAVILRASDGTEVAIAHSRLAKELVVRLNSAVRDASCEIWLSAPQGIDAETAIGLARTAAALSPYAAPRSAPIVFLVPEEATRAGFRLRLRGFAFDREYEEIYRSDVGRRFMRLAEDRSRARRYPPESGQRGQSRGAALGAEADG